jgi:hypothetical protein
MGLSRHETQQLRPFFKERTPVSETPSEKYAAYYEFIRSNGLAKLPRTYFTTTITSGGFNVFVPIQSEEKSNGVNNLDFFDLVTSNGKFRTRTPYARPLTYKEVLSGNTSLAEAYRLDLLNSGKVSTKKNLLIFPPDLGKVPEWTQFDFNLF